MTSITQHKSLFLPLALLALLVAGAFFVFGGSRTVQAGSENAAVAVFDQCSNGPTIPANLDCSFGSWINGILNHQKSFYPEDAVVPHRAVLEVKKGTPAGRTMTIEYQTLKSGIHAYDSLATWNFTQTGANLCQDLSNSDFHSCRRRCSLMRHGCNSPNLGYYRRYYLNRQALLLIR